MKKILVLAIVFVLCTSFSLSAFAIGDTLDEDKSGVSGTASKTESSAIEIIDDSEIVNSNIELNNGGLGVWLWVIIGAAAVVVVIVIVMIAKKK